VSIRGVLTLAVERCIVLIAAIGLGACGARTELSIDHTTDAGIAASSDAGLMADCEVLPDGRIRVLVELAAVHRVVDVLPVFDITGSMSQEKTALGLALRAELGTRLSSLAENVELGLAVAGDYNVPPYGAGKDAITRPPLSVGADAVAVGDALLNAPLWNGGDGPEGQVQAIYLASTQGALGGLDRASCEPSRAGRACFRPHSLRLLVLFTDSPFHEAPDGSNPYDRVLVPGAWTYDETIDAVASIDAHVLGVYSGPAAYAEHLRALAADTGGIEPDATAIVHDVPRNGTEIDGALFDVLERYTTRALFDADITVSASRGTVDGISAVESQPETGGRPLGDSFVEVTPGARLRFSVDISASSNTTLSIDLRANRREVLSSLGLEIDPALCRSGG
jgi:hypothetical protein